MVLSGVAVPGGGGHVHHGRAGVGAPVRQLGVERHEGILGVGAPLLVQLAPVGPGSEAVGEPGHEGGGDVPGLGHEVVAALEAR